MLLRFIASVSQVNNSDEEDNKEEESGDAGMKELTTGLG